MQTIAARNDIPGFAIALVDANGLIFEKGYGYADLATKRPYTSRSVQNIGSISKTFIGISLLQAERDGHLKMTDPINKYLPFRVVHPRFPDQPILLRHLAMHTSGISDAKFYDKAYALTEPMTVKKGEISKREYKEMLLASKNEVLPLGDFLAHFLTLDGDFYHRRNFTKKAPGVAYQYSNVAAALAAHVLEVATGTTFPEWTRDRIFEPAGMENTGWSRADIAAGTHIQHHFSNGRPMPDYALSTYPDGGLRTSIHDLGVYCSSTIKGMTTGNALLPAEDYARLISDTIRIPKDKSVYGYFMEHLDSGFYGHTGGDPGIGTIMYVNEANGVGHLMFFNGTPKDEGLFMEIFLPLVKYGRKVKGR